MNKTELVNEITISTGMPRDAANRSLNAVMATITDALKNGDSVSIQGFGTFSTKVRSPRTARNPITGEMLTVPEMIAPIFRPGKKLKDAVRQ